MRVFRIPEDFRAMVRDVVARLDFGDDPSVVGARAFEAECGFGGRVDGRDLFRFQYIANGGHERFELELSQQQLRDIAGGLLEEVEARPLESNSRVTRGEPLLVWGEYDEDALRVRSLTELGAALDALYSIGAVEPVLFRLWSTSDDQVVAVCNGTECALYIVASHQGYGMSVGDPTRQGTFELAAHELGTLSIAWADCIPWRVARPALLRFAEHGDLGPEVILDGSLPTIFLMLGDFDRASALASRRLPEVEPARTSLPQKSPCGAWAKRLLGSFVELHLIEVDHSILEAITARVAMLLLQYGEDAVDSSEAAHKLTKEIERVRGVGALFATAGDLQIALRRTQEPPTQPVEMGFR